jgi:hypothetical protein
VGREHQAREGALIDFFPRWVPTRLPHRGDGEGVPQGGACDGGPVDAAAVTRGLRRAIPCRSRTHGAGVSGAARDGSQGTPRGAPRAYVTHRPPPTAPRGAPPGPAPCRAGRVPLPPPSSPSSPFLSPPFPPSSPLPPSFLSPSPPSSLLPPLPRDSTCAAGRGGPRAAAKIFGRLRHPPAYVTHC